jgi:hypothetical protein
MIDPTWASLPHYPVTVASYVVNFFQTEHVGFVRAGAGAGAGLSELVAVICSVRNGCFFEFCRFFFVEFKCLLRWSCMSPCDISRL